MDTSNDPKIGDECLCLQISNSGALMATGGSEQVLKVWDIKSGRMLGFGVGHSGTI